MTYVEILESSVEFPFELNPLIRRHEGVPAEVVNQCPQMKPWFLVAWHDDTDGTIGLLHKTRVLILRRDDVLELAVNFMRPAKGPGLVTIDVSLQSQRNWFNLLHTPGFREEGLDWIAAKKSQIEAIFGVPLAIFDRGADY